jgi:hypothetical protein
LSSRPERSVVEGPAVLPAWYRKPFHPAWVGKAGGQLYWKTHARPEIRVREMAKKCALAH